MTPEEIIQLASVGISAGLQIIAKLKARHGLTDSQVLDAAATEDDATTQAISGYLKAL